MRLITETLLEMHYHRALVPLFEEKFGKRWLRLLKPSPNEEVFRGFDQGWVRAKVTTGDFLDELEADAPPEVARRALAKLADDLKDGIQSGATEVGTLLFGYFLQFKPVSVMKNRKGDAKKIAGLGTPFYRVELSLEPRALIAISAGLRRPRRFSCDNAESGCYGFLPTREEGSPGAACTCPHGLRVVDAASPDLQMLIAGGQRFKPAQALFICRTRQASVQQAIDCQDASH